MKCTKKGAKCEGWVNPTFFCDRIDAAAALQSPMPSGSACERYIGKSHVTG
jgi:hypothetical protein